MSQLSTGSRVGIIAVLALMLSAYEVRRKAPVEWPRFR